MISNPTQYLPTTTGVSKTKKNSTCPTLFLSYPKMTENGSLWSTAVWYTVGKPMERRCQKIKKNWSSSLTSALPKNWCQAQKWAKMGVHLVASCTSKTVTDSNALSTLLWVEYWLKYIEFTKKLTFWAIFFKKNIIFSARRSIPSQFLLVQSQQWKCQNMLPWSICC